MDSFSPDGGDRQKSLVVRHFDASTEYWDSIYGRQDFDGVHIQERMERVLAYV